MKRKITPTERKYFYWGKNNARNASKKQSYRLHDSPFCVGKLESISSFRGLLYYVTKKSQQTSITLGRIYLFKLTQTAPNLRTCNLLLDFKSWKEKRNKNSLLS